MRRTARTLGPEVALVLMILGTLAATLWVVVQARRRAASRAVPVVVAPPPSAAVEPSPPADSPEAPAAPPPSPPPPVRDETPAALAEIDAQIEQERKALAEAERRAAELLRAKAEIDRRSEDWSRRKGSILEQLDTLRARAEALEGQVDVLARKRDVLQQARAEVRAELARARSRDGFAVLPYKGANGTWKRPIPIECRDGMAIIQPGGPSFNMLELTMGRGYRASPLAAAVGHYLAHAATGHSPDGAPIVPYILFVVRPDGIRPYYEARGILEPLGIAYGYELVEADQEIEFPDLSDPAEWSEEVPLRSLAALRGTVWPRGEAGEGGAATAGPRPETGAGRPIPGPGVGGPEMALGAGGSPGLILDPPATRPRGNGSMGAWPGADVARSDAPDLMGATGWGVADSFGRDARSVADSFGREAGDDRELQPLRSTRSGLVRGRTGDEAGEPLRLGVGEGSDPGAARDLTGDEDLDPALSTPRPRVTSPLAWDSPTQPGDLAVLRPLEPERRGIRGALAWSEAGRRRLEPPIGTGLGMEPGGASGANAPTHAAPIAGLGLAQGEGGEEQSGRGGVGGGLPGSRIRPEPTLDMTVSCGPSGVVIQPGGYRLSREALSADEDRLAKTLRSIVRRRQVRTPEALWRPRVTFLVEPGGESTYWQVRRHMALSGLDWPARLSVVEGHATRLLPDEVRR